MGEVTDFTPTELQTLGGCSTNLTMNHILHTARNKVTINNKELIIEILRMWNVKAKVIQVIIGATGTISKSLRQYLSNTPGKHEIIYIYKKRPVYILQKVLMFKYKTYFMDKITLHVAQLAKKQNSCNTIYPRNIVCFRYIILNTMHKGDKKDDSNNNNSNNNNNNNNAWTIAM
jgi:hypothetical protein